MAGAVAFEAFATPEILVNSFEVGDQRVPLLAADGQGNALVIWQSRNQDDPGWGVHAQRLDRLGRRLGDEFRINNFNDGSQDGQHLAMAADGAFVVVWNGPDRFSSGNVISARHFDPEGQALAGDIRVSDLVDGLQILPRVALQDDGRALVAWEAGAPDFNILARSLDAAGPAADPVALINTSLSGAQRRVDVMVGGDASRRLVWQDAEQDGSDWGVFVRCLDGAGTGPAERQVNQTTLGQQWRPRLAGLPDGGFVVVWQDTAGHSSFVYRRVMLRFYGGDCQARGPETQVNQFDEGIQDLPELAVDGVGRVIVIWQSLPPAFENQGIFGRRLAADGRFLGDEFRLSLDAEAFQDFPSLAALADGGFWAAWESAGQDQSGFGIVVRRFFAPQAAELILLGGEDQEAWVGQAFSEPIEVALLDQWDQPQTGQVIRFETAHEQAGVRFANGLPSIEVASDGLGRASVEMTANETAGSFAVEISVPGTGLRRFVTLSNRAAPVPLAVPALTGWGLAALLLLVIGTPLTGHLLSLLHR